MERTEPSRRLKWLRILVALLVVLAAVWGISQRDEITVTALRGELEALGGWAPLAYVAAYAVGTVAFLPGSLFTLAGGLLFGPWLGGVYALVGATVGATVAFLVARYLAADWVAARAGGRLGRLIDGVNREGWRFVAFTRLVPVFPFNLLNYALGLTAIRLLPYVSASLICMAPGALAYAWLGHAGAQAASGARGAIQTGLVALGLLAAVVFLPRLVKRLRQRRPV